MSDLLQERLKLHAAIRNIYEKIKNCQNHGYSRDELEYTIKDINDIIEAECEIALIGDNLAYIQKRMTLQEHAEDFESGHAIADDLLLDLAIQLADELENTIKKRVIEDILQSYGRVSKQYQ